MGKMANYINPLYPSPSMPQALWNGTVIAASDSCLIVDGSTYFPPASVRMQHLRPGGKESGFWKGEAKYYTVVAAGKENPDAAWQFPVPRDDQKHVRGYFAFWKGVEIIP